MFWGCMWVGMRTHVCPCGIYLFNYFGVWERMDAHSSRLPCFLSSVPLHWYIPSQHLTTFLPHLLFCSLLSSSQLACWCFPEYTRFVLTSCARGLSSLSLSQISAVSTPFSAAVFSSQRGLLVSLSSCVLSLSLFGKMKSRTLPPSVRYPKHLN